MQVQVPVQSVTLEVDPANLPTGPQGPEGPSGGPIRSIKTARQNTQPSTASTAFVPTGVTIEVEPQGVDSKFSVSASGVAGCTMETIVHLALFRNGVNVTPQHTGVCAVRVGGSLPVEPWAFEIEDAPGTTSPVTYEVYMRVQSQGTAYLGRRGADSLVLVPSTIKAMEYA